MTHLWQQKSCVKIPGESRMTMQSAAAESFFQQLPPADASSAASLLSQSCRTQPDLPGSEPALYPAGLLQFLNIIFSSPLTKESTDCRGGERGSCVSVSNERTDEPAWTFGSHAPQVDALEAALSEEGFCGFLKVGVVN